MADGQQIGRLLLIKIGDGNTTPGPETFNPLCGLKTTSFNMSANEVDTTVRDCANPAATPQKTAEPGIKNRTFTGNGKFIKSDETAVFVQHVINATKFNAQVVVPGMGTFTGPWFVSDYELSGEDEGNMDFSGTFIAAGVLDFEIEA
ncbi:phage tail protein [Ochrobactrum sp. C6C9]|uniref:phage tail tube protein n=1 Tax=Ochrobactrum sp. C6C9 TaxID=2736662 RepID=UPI00352FFB84|nr:phage tail protein [Ochrobactrum sp. C6C9]